LNAQQQQVVAADEGLDLGVKPSVGSVASVNGLTSQQAAALLKQ
jgi:hypothetical protein